MQSNVLYAAFFFINIDFACPQENSTEVPPSPVSVSSSSLDEIFRPGYPSPVSPLDGPFPEDCSSSQVFGEPSSELPGTYNLIVQFSEDSQFYLFMVYVAISV